MCECDQVWVSHDMGWGRAGVGWRGLFAALSQMYIHKSGQMLANPSCTDVCACMRSLMHMLSIT
jgi:hypothetical protein